jgi:hypothetical protein
VFDSLYATETDRALTLRTQAPPPPPAGVGVFDGFWRAVSTAPAAAILDIATTADRASGSRQQMDFRLQAERGALPRLDRTAETQRQTLERQVPVAPPFRLRSPIEEAVRESLTPDPVTTGAASQAAFGIVNLLTKAGIFGAAGGAGFGAASTGLIEGGGESQRLQAQGVDASTAFEAGAVKALTTGVGLAAPVAGSTLLRSLGIVAATGPGTFAAEQIAIRGILERADYGKQAEQYDPTDLTGLIVSTLAPAGFAALVHGARGMRARAVPPEAVDAAQTLNLKQSVEQAAPVRDQAAARQVHLAAVDQVETQILRGEPVAPRAPVEPEVQARVEQVMREAVAAEAPALARELRAAPLFPRVDEIGRIDGGLGGMITPRVIAEGMPLYRETNATGLDDLLRYDKYENRSSVFVADNPDIAIGQGANRGVQVEFRPNALSGEQNIKPAPDSAGREFVTDVLAPRAVQAVTFPSGFKLTELRGLSQRVLKAEFTAEKLPDGRTRYTRKSEAELQPKPAKVAAPKAEARPAADRTQTRAPETPEVMAAREAVAAMPDTQIEVGRTAEGEPILRSMKDLMDEADAEVARSETDATAFEAAVACALRAGE